MDMFPEVRRIGYDKIIQHVLRGFTILATGAGIIFLATGTMPKNVIALGLAVLLFMFIDITGLDGGAVYAITRLLGSKADYDDHVSYIARWKPYVFAIQAIGIILITYGTPVGAIIYYTFIGVELAYFWATIRRVHRLDLAKTLLILAIIVAVMLPSFLSPQSITTMSEVARGNLNVLLK